jgi:hypothetical protein
VKPTPRYLTLQDLPSPTDKAKSHTATSEQEEVSMIVQQLSQRDDAFCFIALHSVVPTSTDEPSLQEALNSTYAKEWQDAIDETCRYLVIHEGKIIQQLLQVCNIFYHWKWMAPD